VRLCEAHGIAGDGVERRAGDGEQARQRAAERGVSERVTFHSADAATWNHPVFTLAEWDDFESDWRAGIERLGTPAARAFADQRRDGYLSGYRGVVGFGWLILTPA